jgi:DNA-binding NtrC family response regulator
MREKLRILVAEMVRGGVPLELARREFERVYLEEVLATHEGTHSAAARELGIHRNTLAKKLEAPTSRLKRVSLAS